MKRMENKIGSLISISVTAVLLVAALGGCADSRFGANSDNDSAITASEPIGSELTAIKADEYTVHTLVKRAGHATEFDEIWLEYAYIDANTVNFRFSVARQDGMLSEGAVLTAEAVTQKGDSLQFQATVQEESYHISCQGERATVEVVIDGKKEERLSGDYNKVQNAAADEELPQPSALPQYTADRNTDGFEMDAVLAKGIRSYLGLSQETTLTKELLKNMWDLYIWDDKLVTLKGIQYLENLEILMVGDTYLSDITELTSLKKLKQFSIGSGFITEIPDFSQNAALQEMHINGNLISDLKPITTMPALRVLDLSGNRVTGVSALREVHHLEILDLSDNVITDYSALQSNSKLQKALPLDYHDYLEVEQEAKRLVSAMIRDDMSALEKEMVLHQYLVGKMSYSEKTRPQKPLGYYGVIASEGVCGDYADAMTLLSAFAGLDVMTLSSDTHAWNMIKLGGHYYHVDLLWDDEQETMAHFNRSTAYVLGLNNHSYDLRRYPIAEQDMNPLLYAHLITAGK